MHLPMLGLQEPIEATELAHVAAGGGQGANDQGRVPDGQIRVDRPRAVRANAIQQEGHAAAGYHVLRPAGRRQAHRHEARQRHRFQDPPLGGCIADSTRRLRRTASRRMSQLTGFRGQRWKYRAWPIATRAGMA